MVRLPSIAMLLALIGLVWAAGCLAWSVRQARLTYPAYASVPTPYRVVFNPIRYDIRDRRGEFEIVEWPEDDRDGFILVSHQHSEFRGGGRLWPLRTVELELRVESLQAYDTTDVRFLAVDDHWRATIKRLNEQTLEPYQIEARRLLCEMIAFEDGARVSTVLVPDAAYRNALVALGMGAVTFVLFGLTFLVQMGFVVSQRRRLIET